MITDINQVIQNPRDPKIQAVFVRAHLKLIKTGLRANRNSTPRKILDKAEAITGQIYKARQYDKAIIDLTYMIDT